MGPFLLTFIMVMFVLMLQFLWQYIDDLVGKGLEWTVIAELLFYACGNLIPMALPLATLLSSIMAVGNLGEHNELLALKASGISLQRILAPLAALVLLITVSDFVFSNNIIPYINLKFNSLLYDVKHQRPELQLKEGVFFDGIDNYTIRVNDKDEKNGALRDIIIYDHSKGSGNRSVIIADSGFLRMTSNQKYLILTLYDGSSYEEEKESGGERKLPFRTNKFKEQEAVFELTGYGFERTDENLFKNRAQMLNLGQLTIMSDSLQREQNSRTMLQVRNFFHTSTFRHYSDFDVAAESRPYKIPVDTLMQALNVEQRLSAVEKALLSSKEAQSNLSTHIEDLRYSSRELNLHSIEWHLKFAFPLSCLIFFFIGAPLGAIIRKGGFGTPFLISLFIFLLYYIVSMAFKRLARDGAWDPAVAIWMSSLVTIPMGIFFTYKAATDKRFSLPKWYSSAASWVGKIFSNK